MPKYEKYEFNFAKFNNLPVFGDEHKLLEKLNKIGEKGWKPFTAYENKPVVAGINFIFQWNTTKLHKEIVIWFFREKIKNRIE